MHRSARTETDVLIYLWLLHRLISEVPLAQYSNTKLGCISVDRSTLVDDLRTLVDDLQTLLDDLQTLVDEL
jgi:hypothetical protein